MTAVLLFLANVALVSSVACGCALLLFRFGRRTSLPFRHGVLLAALCLAVASPVLLGVSSRLGCGVLPLPHPAEVSPTPPPSAPAQPPHVATPKARAGGSGGQVVLAAGALLAGVWACGCVLLSFRFLRGLLALVRFRKGLPEAVDADLCGVADAALGSLGVARDVDVCESSLTAAPLSLGLLRPAIVLPEGLAGELAPDQLRLVLLHEAAHLLRWDHEVALLQSVAAVLFWWNPLVHALSARLSRLREQLCDDLAIGTHGGGRGLAEALFLVAEWDTLRREGILGAAGLLDDAAADLEVRIARLLAPKREIVTRLSGAARAGVLALTVCSTALAVTLSPRCVSCGPARGDAFEDLAVATDDYSSPHQEELWRMSLPAGFQHTVMLTPVGNNRYRLLGPDRFCFSGIYEARGDRLVIVEPNDPRLLGFEWERRGGGRLILVNQPHVSKIGSYYIGALLTRL